jgi:hypothetical protein
MKQLCGVFALLLITHILPAQDGWEAGPWAGVAFYFGDLNTSYNLSRPGPAAGFGLRHNVNERISLRLGIAAGQVSASDANAKNSFERARNLSFQSSLTEGSLQLEFNFLPYIHGSKDYFFTPYMLLGFTATGFNPKAEYEGRLVELRPLGTEGQFRSEEYATMSSAWLYGGGFKVDLSYRISLNAEIAARALASDYLDDVSGVYADIDDIRRLRGNIAAALADRSIPIPGVDKSQLGQPGVQRGNSKNNDTYIYVGIGILYYFGDLKCPDGGSRKRLR